MLGQDVEAHNLLKNAHTKRILQQAARPHRNDKVSRQPQRNEGPIYQPTIGRLIEGFAQLTTELEHA